MQCLGLAYEGSSGALEVRVQEVGAACNGHHALTIQVPPTIALEESAQHLRALHCREPPHAPQVLVAPPRLRRALAPRINVRAESIRSRAVSSARSFAAPPLPNTKPHTRPKTTDK